MFIYKIVNKISLKSYVGQTMVSVERRYAQHISKLRTKTHPCKQMQEDFNLYGEQSFHVVVLEFLFSNRGLDKAERKWINRLDSTNPKTGYNKETGGRSNKKLTTSAWNKGLRLSKSHIANIKKAKAGKSYRDIAKANCKKVSVTSVDLLSGFAQDFITMKECARHLGVSNSAVRCHLVRGSAAINNRWKVILNMGVSY